MDLADRMRSQNIEQFETLVRMHLSFELDLNTDDNGMAINEKGKFRKRFQFSKKHKIQPAAKSGCPILSKECLVQLRNIMAFLMKENNVVQEGIFRRTGSVSRQNELKMRVNDGSGASLTLESGTYSVHDCASVLKGILADLPEPLLTDTYGPAHLQMADLCNNLGSPSATKATRLLHSMQLLILLLPPANRTLLKEIIEMLHETIKHESSNKMSADSLATLFTPHLICPKKLTPEALHATSQNLSGIVSFMISRGPSIFDIPPKLLTDIRAYFVEQRRKQTLSPEQVLDESVTCDSTANTVYTFVDRERTAQAHDQNPTDTCLAQLYAYIQSLPESSKKRKLIKQFNKENGQGTPLQVQKLHRLKNNSTQKSHSKSLGDSIKRHIFQKNLMSKTPKPTVPSFQTPSTASTSTAVRISGTCDTPNRTYPAQSIPLKSRVLFQSPITTSASSSSAQSSSISESSEFGMVAAAASTSFSSQSAAPAVIASTSGMHKLKLRAADDDDDEPDPLESTEFERLSETITKLQSASHTGPTSLSAKKSVAFRNDEDDDEDDGDDDDDDFVGQEDDDAADDEDIENRYDESLKSRHRSEPNLSKILTDQNTQFDTPRQFIGQGHRFGGSGGRYIANKLLKGVSMVNLMLPTSGHPTMRRSASSLFKTAAAPKDHHLVTRSPTIKQPTITMTPQLIRREERETSDSHFVIGADFSSSSEPSAEYDQFIDDPDFVATPNNSQRTSTRRYSDSDDYASITTTPTTAAVAIREQHQAGLARKSMSPITKSTQRMSKAMQESIMTPRSRKPVMLNGPLFAGLTDQPPAMMQSSFSSLREEDEDELLEAELNLDDMTTEKSQTTVSASSSLYKSRSEGDFNEMLLDESTASRRPLVKHPSEGTALSAIAAIEAKKEPLTSTFRNYLFGRSVISASPVDSSFSSHPDDFGGSSADLNNVIESNELSESLLYCLDGNKPPPIDESTSEVLTGPTAALQVNDDDVQPVQPAAAAPTVPTVPTTAPPSRKRTNGGEDGDEAMETRQYFDELHPKKMAVVPGVPGETSF